MLSNDQLHKIRLLVNGYAVQATGDPYTKTADVIYKRVIENITTPLAANIFIANATKEIFLYNKKTITQITNTIQPYDLVKDLGWYNLLSDQKVLNSPSLLGGAIVVPITHRLAVVQNNPTIYMMTKSGYKEGDLGIIKNPDITEGPGTGTGGKTPDVYTPQTDLPGEQQNNILPIVLIGVLIIFLMR